MMETKEDPLLEGTSKVEIVKAENSQETLPDSAQTRQSNKRLWIFALIVSTNALVMGCSMSATGILVPALQVEEDENLRIDLDTGSNMATVWVATGTALAPFGGLLSDRLGRRLILITMGQPLLALSWVLIAAARDLKWIYAARVVAGMSDGLIFPLVPVYISEISAAKSRATLVNVVAISFCFGCLLVYLLGWFMTWRMVHWFLLGLSIPCGIMMLFIPETPYFLARKGRIQDAERVLVKIRPNAEEAKEEIQEIIKGNRKRVDGGTKSLLHPSFLKTLASASLVNALTMASGIAILFMFTVNILEESGAKINPYSAAVAISAMRLVASFTCSYVMRRCNRLTLLLWSSAAIAIFYFIMAGSSYLESIMNSEVNTANSGNGTIGKDLISNNSESGSIAGNLSAQINTSERENVLGNISATFQNSTNTPGSENVENDSVSILDYIPALCLVCILSANAVGYVPVVRVLTSEVFPTRVRSSGAALAFTATGISLAGTSIAFPILLKHLGFAGTSLVFGGFALSAGLAGKLLLPETKDRTLTDIQDQIQNKKQKDGEDYAPEA